MDYPISIEHEMFQLMKSELNMALVTAIMAARDGNIATVTLKLDVESFEEDPLSKTLMPIDFNVKVTTKRDIMNGKQSIPSIRVHQRSGNLFGGPADGQVTINDYIEQEIDHD